jgi:hypothetical protein
MFKLVCLHIPSFLVGISIHACCMVGCHFVPMEGDQEIFKAILEPFIVDSVTEVFKKQRLNIDGTSKNLEDEELSDLVIVACNQYCK